MPEINESLAWGRAVIRYTTPYASHNFGFHVKEMNSVGGWAVPDGGETTIFETCTAFMLVARPFLPTGTTFDGVTVYKNQLSPLPTLFWLTGVFDNPASMPNAVPAPANTLTLNMRTLGNRRAKFVFCDTNGNYPVPALVTVGGFPTVTEDLADYIINNSNIVTIDGEQITTPVGLTVDVNETLSRRYGVAENTFSTP